MEQPLDCAVPDPAYQDFKIDYAPELDEIKKLKVTTTALETTMRTKLTEALRQKRLHIAMVGGAKPPALRGVQVANLTFDVKRDRSRELDELRHRGAARTQPWAEAHAVKMFSRKYTKNVIITQGHSDPPPTLTAKLVCERLFNQPSKKNRVLARLMSEQIHEIEATIRVKHSKRPTSEYLVRCDEGDETLQFDKAFFQDSFAVQTAQWDSVVDNDESSDNASHIEAPVTARSLLISDVQPTKDEVGSPAAAAPKQFTERTPSNMTHQLSTGTNATNAGVRSPSITSIPSYEGNVECDGSSATTPVASHLTHMLGQSRVPSLTEPFKPRHHQSSLPPHIINDPGFVDYLQRTNMDPVPSTYISYKITCMGDKIDEQYADQISKALASVFTDTVETEISYNSFHKAAQKLILEGSNTVDRMFMLACFGRRVLEGAPELHSMVKSYTHTVMEEWVSFMENYSDTEIARDYDLWDGEEYPEIFHEFPPPALLRVESIETKVMRSKCNSVEALTVFDKASQSCDQPDAQVEMVAFVSGNAPSVLSLGTVSSTSPNSSIRIVTPRTHKRSRSDIPRTMVQPVEVVPSVSGHGEEPQPVQPVRKSSLRYIYDTAMNLSPAIVHTVWGILAYYANKS